MIIKNSIIRQKLSQNRYKILFGVIGIILLLLILGNLSDIARQQHSEKRANSANNQTSNTVANTSNVYKPQQTVISGSNISEATQTRNANAINSFVEYCNNGEIQKAYNMLTDECKELMFQNVQKFYDNYVRVNFPKKTQASMQSWYNDEGDTYKVTFGEDMLATGKVNEENNIVDYITVVTRDNEEKLNVNNYIGRKAINKTGSNNGITINIESKDMYLEYETYNMKVTNNTEKDILLDSRQDTNTVYLKSKAQSKYRAILHEIAQARLTISSKTTKSIEIKFNKTYNPGLRMITMNFDDIIMDIEEYNNLQDKTKYNNISRIEIAL